MCISGEVICAGLKHKGCIWKVNKPMNNLIGSFLRSFLFSESGAMFKICSVSLAIGIITFLGTDPTCKMLKRYVLIHMMIPDSSCIFKMGMDECHI